MFLTDNVPETTYYKLDFIILITCFWFANMKVISLIRSSFQIRSMHFVGSTFCWTWSFKFWNFTCKILSILNGRHQPHLDLYQLKWCHKRNHSRNVCRLPSGESLPSPSQFSINAIGDIIFCDHVCWPIDFLFRSHMQFESRTHSIWDGPRFGRDDGEAKQMTKMCCPRVEQRVERTSTDNDKFRSLFQPVFVSKNVYFHAFIYHRYVRNFCSLNYRRNSQNVLASVARDLQFCHERYGEKTTANSVKWPVSTGV